MQVVRVAVVEGNGDGAVGQPSIQVLRQQFRQGHHPVITRKAAQLVLESLWRHTQVPRIAILSRDSVIHEDERLVGPAAACLRDPVPQPPGHDPTPLIDPAPAPPACAAGLVARTVRSNG